MRFEVLESAGASFGALPALAGTRRPARVVRAALLLAALGAPLAAQEPRFRDQIDVSRVVVEARAVDPAGNPIPGLSRDDFRVLVDGEPMTLESADWIEQGQVLHSVPGVPGERPPATPAAPPGRLIVFFFQVDFASVRLTGLMRMTPKAKEFLAGLNPNDRVAVVSYDSHLKLHLDFTTDHEKLRGTIQAPVLLREPSPLPATAGPSLAASIAPELARQVTSPEQAILVTARALAPLAGSKTMVLFGWGLGRLHGRAGVFMPYNYGAARQALIEARTSVCVLDITDADYHDLEVGLEKVAFDTGGFYAKTNIFPDQAIRRLSGALAGYYELVFERPPLPRGRHAISCALAHGRGTVLCRSFYDD